MDKKRIPIGFEDFKEIREENLYFVDKTMMIQELLDGSKVTLLTRPRRFGKTLNLSMVRRFFEDERTTEGEKIDNRGLFEGLAIMGAGETYLAHMGQYPVITLSLKSGKQDNYDLSYTMLKRQIVAEFSRHRYVLDGTMDATQRDKYQAILGESKEPALYIDALRFLSECLYHYHGREAVILIDEYDVPLENAYFQGFYDEMIGFIRSLFESALKTNPYLKLGVVTGCLRISKESIFTGLNNLEIHSIVSPKYSSCFGFTGAEVQNMLAYYNLEDRFEEAKAWYDGYLFGNTEIYNPWSILSYASNAKAGAQIATRPYWSNTSGNGIVKELVEDADDITREELEILMDGGTIEKPVHEEITYGDIHSSRDNLWNFLFFTGYLKMKSQRIEGETIYLEMTIPNKEIRSIYRQSIVGWFDRKIERIDRSPLIKALEDGDCEAAADFISCQLMDTISYFDYAESYYHGFLSGLLKNTGRYSILSNRESGNGRPDLILKEKKFMGRAIIIELKAAKTFAEMETRCDEALAQIEAQGYAAPLIADGYRPILKYGIALYKKGCIVKTEK
ncbi:AAA family ATPase [Emergencia sp. 1XD21-10]|uniref:AAA family ATPase n=1 Tax=Emergencia sp. 1XD21-10 TaxID=2304569 RepID=UPI00137AFAF5|nr:AAA family ATPase [Emergencia sp. 1XD21-10]NCE99341.1 AAA family ATPase [Emergencia sp. 1XD21-10]